MSATNFKLQHGDAKIIADIMNTSPCYISQVNTGFRNNPQIKKALLRLRELKLKHRQELIAQMQKEFKQ